MSAKERFLCMLLTRNSKERWVAALLLSAPPEVLKTLTEKNIFVLSETKREKECFFDGYKINGN